MSLVDRILIHENHAIEIVFKYRDEYQQTIEYVLGLSLIHILLRVNNTHHLILITSYAAMLLNWFRCIRSGFAVRILRH